MAIKKYTCITFIDYHRLSGINEAVDLDTDISQAHDTINEQFSKYCDIEENSIWIRKIENKVFFDLWFTLYFEKEKLNFLKMKDPDLYNLLEDAIRERNN
jgi:hypothetical protein